MHVKVETDGVAPYELEVKTRDIAAWEAIKAGRGVADLRSPSMTTIYQLAHLAARRTGKTDANIDVWIATTDLEVLDESDPTELKAPSAD